MITKTMQNEKAFIGRVVIISIVLLLVISVLIVRIVSDIDEIKSIRIDRVVLSGDYAKALEMAESIDDESIYTECKYNIATQMLEAKEYSAAAEQFKLLGDYKSSSYKLLQSIYGQADDLYKSGDFEAARDKFISLGNYSDSADRQTECMYSLAQKLLSEGEYMRALSMFAGLGEYSDSQDMAYAAALAMTGDEESARVIVSSGGMSAEAVEKAAKIAQIRSEMQLGKLDAGRYHTVYARSDGSAAACGDNSCGQCNVADWSYIVQICAGAHHTVGLRSDGTVVAVGDNQYGQCNVSEWKNVVSIAAGDTDTVALLADGSFVSCGYHSFDSLSQAQSLSSVYAGSYGAAAINESGYLFSSNKSIHAEDPQLIIDMVIGTGYTAALYADGTLKSNVPSMAQYENIVAVESSPRAIIATDMNGKVSSHFFRNSDYMNFEDLVDIQLCAAGTEHYVFLTKDGQLIAFGDNSYGQCNVSELAAK